MECSDLDTNEPLPNYNIDLSGVLNLSSVEWPSSSPRRFVLPSYPYWLRVSSDGDLLTWKGTLSRVIDDSSNGKAPLAHSNTKSPSPSSSPSTRRPPGKKGQLGWASSVSLGNAAMTERDIKFNKLFHLTGQVVLRGTTLLL